MTRGGFVYIMTNPIHSVLYTGVTSDLISRMQQHIYKYYPDSFTAKYNVTMLVYYQFYSTIIEAILEEKRIKSGSRREKLLLINSINPEWNNLWEKEVSHW
jgi:putative endonuclease